MIIFPDLELDRIELKKLNVNLSDILDILYQMTKDSDEPDPFSEFFPPLIYLQNPQKCVHAAKELCLMIEDDFEHTLPPLHQYVLYMMLRDSQDLYDDMQEDTDDPRPEVEGEPLEIDDIDEEFSLDDENLEDPQFYLDCCFRDTDFLYVAEFFELFKNDISEYRQRGMDLDQYVDLMPNDIREEYENIKREKSYMI